MVGARYLELPLLGVWDFPNATIEGPVLNRGKVPLYRVDFLPRFLHATTPGIFTIQGVTISGHLLYFTIQHFDHQSNQTLRRDAFIEVEENTTAAVRRVYLRNICWLT